MKITSLLMICIMLIVSGCGSNGAQDVKKERQPTQNGTDEVSTTTIPSPTKDNIDPEGYMMADSKTVVFIRWTETDSELNGHMQFFRVENAAGSEYDSSTHSFSGVREGKNVSLNFTGSIWTDGLSGKTWTGTIDNDQQLTLVAPSSDGTLQTLVFSASSVNEYNNTVNNIKSQVESNNAELQRAQAIQDRIAKEKKAVDSANARISNIIIDLKNSSESLGETVAEYTGVLESYRSHYKELEGNYSTLKANAAKRPLTDMDVATVEMDLASMEITNSSIEIDRSSMEIIDTSVETITNQINELIPKLDKSWQELQQAIAANTSNTPKAKFVEDDINTARQSANKSLSNNAAKFNDAHNTASSIEKQAQDLLKKTATFVAKLKPTE